MLFHARSIRSRNALTMRRGALKMSLLIFVLSVAPLLHKPVRALAVDNAGRRRLETEAVPAWTELQQSMESMRGTMDWTCRILAGGALDKPIYRHQAVRYFFSHGTSGKVCTEQYDESGKLLSPPVVTSYSPECVFQAEATQTDAKTRYAIGDFGTAPNTVRDCTKVVNARFGFPAFAYSGSHYHPILKELIASPNCQVASCRDEEAKGVKVVRVELVLAPRTPNELFRSMDSSTKQITLVLEPGAKWRVLSDVISSPTIGTRSFVAEYVSGGAHAGELLALHNTEYKVNSGEAYGWNTYKFSSISFEPIPDEEFTTASVGYPNFGVYESPSQSPLSFIPDFVWPLGIAILALAGAYWLKRRGRETGR